MDSLIREKSKGTKIHVYVLLTHTFEFISTAFFDLMLGMQTKYTLSMLRSNVLPIDKNRNELTKEALKCPTMTHCLFIDTDIIPYDLNFLDIMISYDLPVVGLLCTKKCPPYEPILMKESAPEAEKLNGFWVRPPKGIVEVDATGTGCLLVKREVFEEMAEPYFKFISSYSQGIYMSEDVYFLNKAKANSFKIYVDTEHTCKHMGPHGYSINDFNAVMEVKNAK